MRRFGLLAMLAMARAARGGTLGDLLQQRDPDDGSRASESGARFALPAGIVFEPDLAYGGDPAQRVDVYRPARAEGAPVIVMVHGGGWRRGDKGGPSMVKNKVLHWVGGKGCVLVSVNYRVVPAANPAQQAEDVGRAVAFVQGRARPWGGDPARVVLIGHSAGAHLVSLIAADASLVTRAGGQGWLATIPIDSAAFDVEAIMNRRHYGLYDTAFGSEPALWREASPIQRLKAKPATPMLLVCSSRRSDSCPPAQAFAAKANGLGGRVRVLPVELNHLQLNDQLGAEGPYTAAVDEFLAEFGIR